MKTYDTTTLQLLEAGRTKIVGIIRFEFGSGTYGFVKGKYPLTYGGLEYIPGGVIEIPDLSYGSGIVSRSLEIRLSESPDDGLTPAVLMSIEDEDYRDKRVIITDLHYHPTTNAFLMADEQWRGYVDTVSHEVDEQKGFTIVGRLVSRAQDYTRRNGRKRNHLDQQRRSPGDKVYVNAPKRGRESVWWGKVKKGAKVDGPGPKLPTPGERGTL